MSSEIMYTIRYTLPPEEPKKKRLDMLLEFCEQGKMDDVMFFFMAEEYNRGQWRKSDYQPALDFCVEAMKLLNQKGIKASINPWNTFLHEDRGRKSEGLKYRRMVLENGFQCVSVACPLCEDWQKILTDAYEDFARAGFKRIWLEDDLRFHNHGGGAWGGCFCDHHMKVLKERGMQANTREELVANMNAKDIVHPDRILWLTLNAEAYTNVAAKVRASLDKVDPKIELGLMTSRLIEHDQEGRNWDTLISAMGGPGRAIIRPHACPYNESCHLTFFMTFGNLSMTLGSLPKGVETFFEEENGPTSRFSKSAHQTKMQMACAIDGGCDGLTLNILDFVGTGWTSEPEIGPALAETKHRLEALRDLTSQTQPIGIQATLPNNTTYVAPGTGVADIRALPTVHYGWFMYLNAFGYPCINQPKFEGVDSNETYALTANAIWAIPDDELKKMLQTATVLLDMKAVEVIEKRKMLDLIGIKGYARHLRNESVYSFEQHVDVPEGQIPERASVNVIHGECVNIYDLLETGQAKTIIHDCYSKPMGSGTVMYKNAQGGRGLVLPHIIPDNWHAPIHNWTRKSWIDRWMIELGGGVKLPHLVNGSWMYVSARESKSLKTIFVANQLFEVYKQLKIRLPDEYTKLDWKIELHGRDERGAVKLDGNILTVDVEVIGSDWMLLAGR